MNFITVLGIIIPKGHVLGYPYIFLNQVNERLSSLKHDILYLDFRFLLISAHC